MVVPFYLVIVFGEVFAFHLSLPLVPPHSKFFCRPHQGTFCTGIALEWRPKWTVQAHCVVDHSGVVINISFGISPFILMTRDGNNLKILTAQCSWQHGDLPACARSRCSQQTDKQKKSTSVVVFALEMFQPYGFSRPRCSSLVLREWHVAGTWQVWSRGWEKWYQIGFSHQDICSINSFSL